MNTVAKACIPPVSAKKSTAIPIKKLVNRRLYRFSFKGKKNTKAMYK